METTAKPVVQDAFKIFLFHPTTNNVPQMFHKAPWVIHLLVQIDLRGENIGPASTSVFIEVFPEWDYQRSKLTRTFWCFTCWTILELYTPRVGPSPWSWMDPINFYNVNRLNIFYETLSGGILLGSGLLRLPLNISHNCLPLKLEQQWIMSSDLW